MTILPNHHLEKSKSHHSLSHGGYRDVDVEERQYSEDRSLYFTDMQDVNTTNAKLRLCHRGTQSSKSTTDQILFLFLALIFAFSQ